MTGVLAMLFCAVVGTARMEGVLGAQVDAVIRERICSADAKGPIYDEAEGAFATCWDGACDAEGRPRQRLSANSGRRLLVCLEGE